MVQPTPITKPEKSVHYTSMTYVWHKQLISKKQKEKEK
jgi:hypothetical protein